MTQVLITGATGKVGNAVARLLVARGETVRALVRDPVAARASLPSEVELVAGDVVDREACRRAAAGVEAVFIAHGIYEQWVRNPAIFDAVNAVGAENVAVAAREAGVARIVHTSTYDVFDADRSGRLDERQLATAPKQTPYERSKQRAEELVLSAAGVGTEVVIVNPGMVYGPGPWASAGLDAALFDCLRGRLPAVPRGAGAGLAFVDAVATGHLAALDRGVAGERYILAGPYVALIDFFRRAVELAGHGRVPMQVPPAAAHAMARASEAVSRITKRPPLLPDGQLRFLLWGADPDSRKAELELGYQPVPLDDGLARTVEWLRASGRLDVGKRSHHLATESTA
jgi:dihydroflavonol-4-reductase